MRQLELSEFLSEFIAESRERLAGVEGLLLQLERRSRDPEMVNRLFRAIHSIKGAAGFLRLDRITELSHAMESVLAMVRSREIQVDSDIVDALLTGVDLLNKMVEDPEQGTGFRIGAILSRLDEILSVGLTPMVKTAMEVPVRLTDAAGVAVDFSIDAFTLSDLPPGWRLYRLHYDLNALARDRRQSPLALIHRLIADGRILDARLDAPATGLEADLSELPLHYEILYATAADADAVAGMAAAQGGAGAPLTAETRPPGMISPPPAHTALPDTAMAHTALPDTAPTDTAMADTAPMAPPAATLSDVCRDPAQGMADKETPVPDGPTAQGGPGAPSDRITAGIRISEEKLDRIVDLVGELTTLQASLTREAGATGNPRLRGIAEKVERISGELRDVSLRVRMLPIATAFGRFTRLARDLTRRQAKEATLRTSGGTTELDKKLIDALHDPIAHILRNSIDHGIEPPDDRIASGKPARATLSMDAWHAGRSVFIRVSDDGRGLDPEVLRRRAVEMSIIPADRRPTDRELLPLIFTPGFSTAAAVTELSGRGVGMDVVKRSIESLRGAVTLENRPGRGLSVTLKIPMTLALMDGLLVRVDETHYLIPLQDVLECRYLAGEKLAAARRRGGMTLRDRHIAYAGLRELLDIRSTPPDSEQVAIIETGDEAVGLGVDRVIGLRQAVAKPLGSAWRDVKSFSGSTLLDDGGVALILSMNHVIGEMSRRGRAVPRLSTDARPNGRGMNPPARLKAP